MNIIKSLRLIETNLPYISLLSKVSLAKLLKGCPMMIKFSSKKPVLFIPMAFYVHISDLVLIGGAGNAAPSTSQRLDFLF